ncbi:3-oxoacyl-ACP synthase [Bacillus sp. FJAT-52991]|uniref:3-oxoacyl-ACP synthase n=1 Tax=Bacillus kandeliae TaxID=3129297 RepID=A0ABZ2N8M5_9BACI
MIGISSTSIYTPENVETAADLTGKTSIPEEVIIEKFGLRKKHVALENEHVSDLAMKAGREILKEVDPNDIDVLIYFGSPHKDYYVWPVAAKIQHELGCKHAYAFELMNVSSCFPIALKVAKDMLKSDKNIRNILLVGGCKESQIIDYENPRSRFMFNFADGGAAALVSRNHLKSTILSSAIITDGAFYDDVKIPAGGSVFVPSAKTVAERQHYIDVKDPLSMKERLDPVSIPNFVSVVEQALERSGYSVDDIAMLLPLHTKRSMFQELLTSLKLKDHQALYLEDYGHMSALDPCFGLYLAEKRGCLNKNDLIVVVSAGTGYTWAATVLQWQGDGCI